MTVAVHKAQPIGNSFVPNLDLRATEHFPDLSTLAAAAALHASNAERIFDALRASLPGGTLDALLRRLLEHRASQLVVVDRPSDG